MWERGAPSVPRNARLCFFPLLTLTRVANQSGLTKSQGQKRGQECRPYQFRFAVAVSIASRGWMVGAVGFEPTTSTV